MAPLRKSNSPQQDNRPIIFVCHSLGGLVCGDALATAQQRPEKHIKQVLNCTRGIVFLGTPHHGSGLAHWAESLAKAIGVLKQTNAEILAVLKSDSEVLKRIQNSFHTMIRSRGQDRLAPIAITCFFEELPLPGVGTVVPSHSAVLPGYIPIGIRRNHMDMTKFEGLEDPGFVAVAREVCRWVKELMSPENTRSPQSRAGGSPIGRASYEAGGSTSEPQVLRITQGGSKYNGPSTISGGSLFQGNYIA